MKRTSSRSSAAYILSSALLMLSQCSAYAASQSAQPVLKAIDPSQAKLDTSSDTAQQAPPSPNPLGGINGAPISGNKAGSPPTQSQPRSQPQSQYDYPAPRAVAPGGYNSQPAPTYGANGYRPTAPAPYGQYSGASGNFSPSSGIGHGAFPPESAIPDFNRPLPPPVSLAPPATMYGSAPSGFLTQPPANAPQRSGSPTEFRLTKLEQAAFGSAYPEHEVADRIDHLEKEVLGAPSSGPIDNRLAALEGKLGGPGTFAQSQSAPPEQAAFKQPPPPRNPMPYMQPQSQPQNQMQYGQPQYSSAGLPTPPPAVSMIESPAKGKKQKDTDSNDKTGKSDKSSSGDYFGLLKRFSQDGVARWRNLPVRVRLPLNTPESWQHSLDLAIKRWGDHLPLKVVPASEPADVDVTWVNKLVPQYLGITRLVMSPAQMQVQIFLLRPTFYLPEIPEKVLANVFLHELGHGLGIFGHSDSKQDLMYAAEVVPGSKGKPAEIKYAGLSDRDVNTLKHVYALPPLPDGFSTSQPLEWGY